MPKFLKLLLHTFEGPCSKCLYWHRENNTCQSKKVCTGGYGRVSILDKIFCKPFIDPFEMEFEEDE